MAKKSKHEVEIMRQIGELEELLEEHRAVIAQRDIEVRALESRIEVLAGVMDAVDAPGPENYDGEG